MIDRFQIQDEDQSYYGGDSESYFPIGYSASPLFWGNLNAAEEDFLGRGSNFYLSNNELTIEDGMFSYDRRTTKFINYVRREDVGYDKRGIRIGKELDPLPDKLYHFGF